MYERYQIDADAYHHRAQTGPCFICEIVARNPVQRRVYRVAEAVRREVGAERMYILSLGSNQGHSHVHWHVAPLPPGVPYREQQLAAFSKGILRIPEEEMASLAARIRHRLENSA